MKEKSPIDLLVTFDRNYIPPFETMLRSLSASNRGERFHLWLMHQDIPEEDLEKLQRYCTALDMELTEVKVGKDLFEQAPVTDRYPSEMYYRMLSPKLLPDTLDRILYIDPDTLILNPLRPLWETDLGNSIFAAASHTASNELMDGLNKLRLDTVSSYFNTGVELIDLSRARLLVHPDSIFAFIREHGEELLLPDQDVFNALYGKYTMLIDDAVWNYDARYYPKYLISGDEARTVEWVMNHTAILHFCGRDKPWKADHHTLFTALYKHYMRLRDLQLADLQ